MSHAVLAALGENIRVCDSADFDATNDYMARGAGLTGAADSKSGIFAGWLRLDGGNASQLTLLSTASAKVTVRRNSGNTFDIILKNAAGTNILSITTSTSYTSAATWLHILSSWDLSATTSTLYISDVADQSVTTRTDDTIDYTDTDWTVGALQPGTAKMNGCLAEVYFAPGQYLDFSVITNRRKFISSSLRPVYLGSDGSLPTGTAPLVYFHLDDGEAVANFATNRGTGGDFTITGTLATGSTSPSD